MDLGLQEINLVKKKYFKGQIKIAVLYPNKYQAGIGSLAIQILYMFFNSESDFLCERVYHSVYPNSIESGRELKDFDIIAVTFQYENDYFNFIEMLLKAGINVNSKDRKNKPLIIAGGPCVTENPAPLSSFIDVFIIGEIEPIIDKLILSLKLFIKNNNLDIFKEIAGIYIPKIMDKNIINKNWVKKLDEIPYPIEQVLPITDEVNKKHPLAFGSSFLVEVSRGCFRGCNFCLIGCQNLPYRERSLAMLKFS